VTSVANSSWLAELWWVLALNLTGVPEGQNFKKISAGGALPGCSCRSIDKLAWGSDAGYELIDQPVLPELITAGS